MASIADLISRPILLRVEAKDDDGKPTGEVLEHWIHPLNFGDHGDLQRWIDSQFPDPYESAWNAIDKARTAGRPFNVAQEQFLLKNAAELALKPRNLIGTPAADELLLSAEGIRRILLAGIKKGDPSFDDEKAAKLLKSMTSGDIMQAYAATQINLVISDPKSSPLDVRPTTRPTGSTASRRTRRAAKARTGGKSSTH